MRYGSAKNIGWIFFKKFCIFFLFHPSRISRIMKIHLLFFFLSAYLQRAGMLYYDTVTAINMPLVYRFIFSLQKSGNTGSKPSERLSTCINRMYVSLDGLCFLFGWRHI